LTGPLLSFSAVAFFSAIFSDEKRSALSKCSKTCCAVLHSSGKRYRLLAAVVCRDRFATNFKSALSEPRGTSTHDFALADKLGVEFGAVEGEVDVEVHAVECTLWRIHALKVLFEVLAAEV
jgi:hypothetical protein